uniref:chemokine XC receptor 1-like n=1 Tax=Semicossyphus pulcher TaxID=241346 RepID=UPI0037E89705
MATNEDFPATATISLYDYDEHYEDEMCNKTSVRHFGASVMPVFYSIMVMLSLFGNILVIVMLAKYENLKAITNTLILNLAVSDLLFTAGLPFWAYYHMYGWTFGDPACKIVTFIFYLGFYSSSILLILMTVHRYIAVMKPLAGIVSTTGCYSILVCVVIWAVSVLVASPVLIFTKVQDQNLCEYEDTTWMLCGIYLQNSLFLVSALVFVFCYSQIMCRLLRPSVQRRKNKTIKLIFTLMVVFFVGWAPYNIVIFLKSLYSWPKPAAASEAVAAGCEQSQQLDYAAYVSRLFAFSHCCLNPVFYVFVGVKFKSHLKKMLKGWGVSNSGIRNRQGRLTITSITSGDEFSMTSR